MPIDSVFQDGRNALVNAQERLRETAGRIASRSVNLDARADEDTVSAETQRADESDLTRDLVDLRLYRHEIGAAARVVRTADEILGTLLDIRA